MSPAPVLESAREAPIGCATLAAVPQPTSTQRTAVALAFLAAAFSLAAVALTAMRTGRIEAVPLFGGLLMLALGIAGVARLRS
jgi:hypothetical protein